MDSDRISVVLTLVVYCGAILLASMAGGWLPLVRRLTHVRLQTYLSFAAGVMLGASMCHMLPESAELAAESWFLWALVGLLTLFFIERFFAFHQHAAPGDEPELGHDHGHAHVHAGHDGACDHREAEFGRPRLAWGAAFIGLSLHTLTGGFALASAVAADTNGIGWISFSVFLATLLHKPADSLTIVSLMVSGGAARRRAHMVNIIFALIIPIGVVLYFTAGELLNLGQQFQGNALAFSAGTFLAIALGDLMPELQFHRHDRLQLSAALLAGVVVMYLAGALGG